MQYINAKTGQRFLAYLVDVALIEVVSSIILSFIPTYMNAMKMLQEFYNLSFLGEILNDLEALSKYFISALTALGLLILVQVPLYFVYLVILPYYWDKQTLGRWFMHIKVVSKDEGKASLLSLTLRELVGGFAILRLLSAFIIFPILYWYFSVTSGRTLSDMISKTRLVDSVFKFPEEEKDSSDSKREFIDVIPDDGSNYTDSDYKVF